jgi:hypothetical protein
VASEASDLDPPRSSQHPKMSVRTADQPKSTGLELAGDLRGVKTLVPLVHLPALLAGPGPSDSSVRPGVVGAACHPHRRLPDHGLPPAGGRSRLQCVSAPVISPGAQRGAMVRSQRGLSGSDRRPARCSRWDEGAEMAQHAPIARPPTRCAIPAEPGRAGPSPSRGCESAVRA